MRRRRRLGIVLGLAAAAAAAGGCSRPQALLPAPVLHPYVHDRLTIATLAIAPVPMTGPLASRIDNGMDRAFASAPNIQLRYPCRDVRQRLNGDRKLVSTMTRILALEDGLPAGAAPPGLDSFMTPHEIDHLRKVLHECDLLLVPSIFEIESTSKKTAGRFTARVYNLKTGKLLLRDTFVSQVNQGGEMGERELVVDLLLRASMSFERLVQ